MLSRLVLSLVLSYSSVCAAEWTTHSSLTAFKQLGFENGYRRNPQSQASYIPYSISDFSEAKTEAEKTPAQSQSLHQQIHHPNDILSNMGVDLPPEEILGKKCFTNFLLSSSSN